MNSKSFVQWKTAHGEYAKLSIQGMLQDLNHHYELECIFVKQVQEKKKSKSAKKGQNNKIPWTQFVDDEIMDKINQNIAKGSLEARVLAKTNSLKTNENLNSELAVKIAHKKE